MIIDACLPHLEHILKAIQWLSTHVYRTFEHIMGAIEWLSAHVYHTFDHVFWSNWMIINACVAIKLSCYNHRSGHTERQLPAIYAGRHESIDNCTHSPWSHMHRHLHATSAERHTETVHRASVKISNPVRLSRWFSNPTSLHCVLTDIYRQ